MAFFCSTKFLFLIFLLSAVPIGILISFETAKPTSHRFEFHSTGWLRECTKWDEANNNFIVSFFEGGLGVVPVPEDDLSPNTVLTEVTVVKDADLAGNGSIGFTIDRPRNRVVVAIGDVIGSKYSAVAAYDLSTWKRLYLTQLSGSGDKSLADDVTVDAEGNAYITDVKRSKIWKVGPNGEYLSSIESPLFSPKEWYHNLFTLNGIAYHPNGYLLVSHTSTGKLFKVDLKNDNEVKLVKFIGDSLSFTDGIEFFSPNELIVTSNPKVILVNSNDDWETATILAKAPVVRHRLATATTMKNGKVYINHLFGMGYPEKKHVLAEAVFEIIFPQAVLVE